MVCKIVGRFSEKLKDQEGPQTLPLVVLVFPSSAPGERCSQQGASAGKGKGWVTLSRAVGNEIFILMFGAPGPGEGLLCPKSGLGREKWRGEEREKSQLGGC